MDQISSQNAGFLGVGGSASRDPSMPPSRASDSGLSGNGLSFGNGNPSFGSIGHHTPRSSIHSQRASFSGLPGSFSSQASGSRFVDVNQTEAELREKFTGLGFSNDGEPTNAPQSSHYSPGPPTYTQAFQPNGSTVWSDAGAIKGTQHFDTHPSHAFADQSYLAKGHRFAERGSISPAGSDQHRGLNSPKYYSAAATPPAGSEQIYRPGSRGPRTQPGPGELDRRLQSLQYAQFMYNAPFQGQYPPQSYEYVPSNFRQGTVPYGFTIPTLAYGQAQPIPTRPAKDHDVGVGVRSQLLEDFRSNSKSNKRYELKVRERSPLP
jgi:mRNA-binding protein PUF3